MGKLAKSLTHVSDKKTKLEIKKQQLMKPKKGANAIKKDKKEPKAKNDYDELRALLKLDSDAVDASQPESVVNAGGSTGEVQS